MSAMDRVEQKTGSSLRGVMVMNVKPGSWTALGGIGNRDILIRVNGQPTPDVASFRRILRKIKTDHPRRVVFFLKRGIHTMYKEIEPDWPTARP